ncbi:hypothetical protein FH609_028410 [Streptomyces sp. 3MP-14]|uniref:Nudix hydrolase domain-containing protein n=1 Tax=Streptomyces mimosae TaxID=2586635 RepID=A0A5N5ZUI6_9ACTN|nr:MULTISPECIES: hypothetical protein [Streptomyces]KAB8159513.1 hypothetical protein FH607_027890 [Streptomyces mimosae]KAB8172791.1 hypothetical protein FH609_028410 [Streptomyces sp. 3MP-14]
MRTTIVRSTVPFTFHVLATTQSNHVLMVRGKREGMDDGWVLPHGTVPQGRCVILAAREVLMKQTGCDRSLAEVLAMTPTTDEDGTLDGFSYVLDGGVLKPPSADQPAEPARRRGPPNRAPTGGLRRVLADQRLGGSGACAGFRPGF